MQHEPALIVAIGASAAGIKALQAIFAEVPADLDVAFVVVTHLGPSRESLLAAVLGRFTVLPDTIIEGGDPGRPGVGQVMPENVVLSISHGRLRFTEDDPAHRKGKPIDVFFSALAADQGTKAVGIVLSGGDGDGTLGVEAIEKHGRFTMFQVADGNGPGNPEMPDSAIASGCMDLALHVWQMAARLIRVRATGASLGGMLRNGQRDVPAAEQKRLQHDFAQLLHSHSGHDFSGYKRKTFSGRVVRRRRPRQPLQPTPISNCCAESRSR